MIHPLASLARELVAGSVRFVLIGVLGANMYGPAGQIDLTLVMKGFDFDTIWADRRDFLIEGVPVPAARLLHIIESKQAAGRPKDQLFLARTWMRSSSC